MDPWCLTPASRMWRHGALWPCTSPPAWGPSPSTATGTFRDTWRMAPSQRTPSRPRVRSSTYKRRNLRRTSRRKKPSQWWRRKEKPSCDLRKMTNDIQKNIEGLASPLFLRISSQFGLWDHLRCVGDTVTNLMDQIRSVSFKWATMFLRDWNLLQASSPAVFGGWEQILIMVNTVICYTCVSALRTHDAGAFRLSNLLLRWRMVSLLQNQVIRNIWHGGPWIVNKTSRIF